ncbi:MAG: fibronectin type III domain-containing protein [Vicinamibacterales bacterium]
MRRLVVPGLLCLLASAPLGAQRLPAADPVPTWGPDGYVGSLVRSGDRVFLSGSFSYVGPPTGGLATISTTDAGDVRTVPTLPGWVERLEPDGAGGWLAIVQPYRGVTGRLMHLGADGTPHPQWVEPVFTSRSPDFAPRLVAVAVEGSRVFVAGVFTTVNGLTRRGVAALDLTTGAVLSWDPRIDLHPAFTVDAVNFLAVSDGVVYAAGAFEAVAGIPRAGLAGFDADTAALTSFAPAACVGTFSYVTALVASAGRVYRGCAGSSTVVHEALGVDGLPLPTWTPPTGVLRLLLATPAALYVAHDSSRIMALDPVTGAALPWGNPDGYATAAVAAAGRLYVTGGFRGSVGGPRDCVAAIDLATGALLDWSVPCEFGRSIAVDGQRVAIGTQSVGGIGARGFAAIDLRTGRPAPVPEVGDDRVGVMYALGDIVVAAVGGPAGSRLKAFSASAATWLPWELPTQGGIFTMTANDRALYVGGPLAALGGVPASGLAAVDLATALPVSASASPINSMVALGTSQGILYAFGATSANTWPTVAIDTNTGNPRGFAPSPPPGRVAGFAFAPGRVLAVGAVNDPQVAAEWYALDGGPPIDVGNAAALDFEGWSVSQSGSVVAVTGSRLNVPRAAILDAATGRAAAWDPGAGGAAFTFANVLATPGYVVLAGQFYAAGGRPAFNLAVFPAARVTAPTAVTGSVSGFAAAVRWQPGPAPTATSYVVEAGTAPGAANVGRFSVGAATEVSGTLPPGTYYVRVYGVDEEGESVPSDEVVLQVPAGITLPAAPGTLTSAVTGSVVSLSWGTATGATSYVIDAGSVSGATDIGSFPVGGATSFSAPVPPGTYFVRIRGVNAAGAGPPSNEAVVTAP